MAMGAVTDSSAGIRGDAVFSPAASKTALNKSVNGSMGDVGVLYDTDRIKPTFRVIPNRDALARALKLGRRSDVHIPPDMKYGLAESSSHLVYKPASFLGTSTEMMTLPQTMYVCSPPAPCSGGAGLDVKPMQTLGYWPYGQPPLQELRKVQMLPEVQVSDMEELMSGLTPTHASDVNESSKQHDDESLSLQRKEGSHEMIADTAKCAPAQASDASVSLDSINSISSQLAQSLLNNEAWPSKEVQSIILQSVVSTLQSSGFLPRLNTSDLAPGSAAEPEALIRGISKNFSPEPKPRTTVVDSFPIESSGTGDVDPVILLKCSICGTPFNCGLRDCKCPATSFRRSLGASRPSPKRDLAGPGRSNEGPSLLLRLKTVSARPAKRSAGKDSMKVIWKNKEVVKTGVMTTDTDGSDFSTLSEGEGSETKTDQKRKLHLKDPRRKRVKKESGVATPKPPKDLDDVYPDRPVAERENSPPGAGGRYNLREMRRAASRAVSLSRGGRAVPVREAKTAGAGRGGRGGRGRPRSNSKGRKPKSAKSNSRNRATKRVTKRTKRTPGSARSDKCVECGRALPKLGWLSMVGRALKRAFIGSGEGPFCSTCWRKMPSRNRRAARKSPPQEQPPPPPQQQQQQEEPDQDGSSEQSLG